MMNSNAVMARRPRQGRQPNRSFANQLVLGRGVARLVAAAALALGRRRGGLHEFGGGQPALLSAGGVELLDPLGRIFGERERAIVVGVELVEILVPRSEIFAGLDLAVLVMVVAAEAFLLAAFRAGFGRLSGWSLPNRERRSRARAGAAGSAGRFGRARLPDQESAGQQEERRGSAGKETQHTNLPRERRFGTRLMSVTNGLLSTIGESGPVSR